MRKILSGRPQKIGKFNDLSFAVFIQIFHDMIKWENQTREPSLHTILTVCQILDIEDIYEAFLGENPFDHVMENLNEAGSTAIG